MMRILLTVLLTLIMFGAEAQKTPVKTKPTAEKPKAESKPETTKPDAPKSNAKPAAVSEGGTSGYKTMDLISVGLVDASLDGILRRFDKGVKIRLNPTDPAQPPLTIDAQLMTFTYREGQTAQSPGGQKSPSAIHMEGHVVIIHPKAEVHSEKADWDVEKNVIVFTGHPSVKTPMGETPMEFERFEISLKDNGLKAENGHWFNMPLMGGAFSGGGGAKATGLEPATATGMTSGDIKDWTAFMTKIKADAAAEKSTPAKQIASLLDPKMREGIASATVEMLVQQKANVLKELNRVMTNPAFYTEAAWQGVSLDADTKALLAKSPRTPEEQVRLNRLLLAAAYPELVAAPPAPKPKE